MKDSYAFNVSVINFKLEKLSLICLEEPAERTSSDTGENVSAKTSRRHPVKSQTRLKIQAKGGHRHSHDEIFCKQKNRPIFLHARRGKKPWVGRKNIGEDFSPLT